MIRRRCSPEQRRTRVLPVQGLRQLRDGVALLIRELLGDVDPDPVVDVASLGSATGFRRWLRRALAAEPLDRSMLRPRGDADRLRARQRRHLDAPALDRLRDRDGQVHLEVSVRALLEDGRGRDACGHVEIAAGPTTEAGLALPGEPDPAAVVDAGRDVDSIALGLLRDTAARAGRAGIVDDAALSTALRAGLRDREEALALRGDSSALAARADPRRGAALRAAAVAGRAGTGGRDGHGDLGAVHSLVE